MEADRDRIFGHGWRIALVNARRTSPYRTWVVQEQVGEDRWTTLIDGLSSGEARDAAQSLNFALPARKYRWRDGGEPLASPSTEDAVAETVYAAGQGMEWLPTVDGSPNVFSYEVARRVLAEHTVLAAA